MDTKVSLLTEFYRGLPKDRAKVESYRHGFEFLDQMLAGGVVLDYGEISFPGLLHKYRLSNIPEGRMNELLVSHIRKECNVCLYFDDKASSLFCVNLDNNHKSNNTVIIPEMEIAVTLLKEILTDLGCEPLVIASGRGYHLWCRLEAEVENAQLHNLMLRSMAKVMLGVHRKGFDYNRVKANFYPDPRTHNTVSLRLFGSEHMKNKVFSCVLARDGLLLDEAASWEAFEAHLRAKTINLPTFQRAYETIAAAF
jgi:hypothetical protein